MKLLYAIIHFLLTFPNCLCYDKNEVLAFNESLDITTFEQLVCKLYDLEKVTIRLLLYTNDNPSIPIILSKNNLSLLRQREKNVVIVHGYLSTPLLFGPLRDVYLNNYDANIIIIDWTIVSLELYPIGVCKMPATAEFLAKFFCQLDIPLSAFHIIGASMGAQLSGLIGKKTVQVCNRQIGRITGLDPGGPLYQNAPSNKRLDSSDALFVDVIHTNEKGLGYYGNCGHVDFHVNCGKVQAGCPQQDEDSILSKCSHSRSTDYWIESVTSNNFIAQSCTGCPEECGGDATPEYIIMGENCPNNSTNKVFWLPTRSTSPYAAGCSLYDSGCT